MVKALWRFVNLKPVKWSSGVIVALLGIYGTFFYERKPSLVFEVLANSPVLDVREQVSKLQIIYAGTDLAATHQTLHFVRFRVSNQGSSDILKLHYDDAAPLGFEVKAGKILETTIQASSYLKENLHPTPRAENAVTFSPVILNAGDSFEVKVLILTATDDTPLITARGKIAGIPDNIPVRELYKDTRDKAYLAAAFGGDVWVQLGRLAAYLMGAVLLIIILGVIIGLPASLISDNLKKRKRAATAEQYKAALGRHSSLKEEFLLKHYVDDTPVFEVFQAIAQGQSPLETRIIFERHLATPSGERLRVTNESASRAFEEELKELEAVGLIVRDGPQIGVSPDFQADAKAFLNFVAPAARPAQPATA